MINSKFETIFLPYKGRSDRKVYIYIPKHNENTLLPVMYMTDGQNLFDVNTPQYGCWNADKAVEAEQNEDINNGIIIVGIDNSDSFRDNDLTPKSIGKVINTVYFRDDFIAQGDEFDSFLINTLIPHINKNYPVLSDKKHTFICGSSSGGLQCFYSGMEHSETFSAIGALSPAFLLYSEDDIKKYLQKRISNDMPYLYIYSGNGEELENEIYSSVETVYDLLSEVGYPYEMMNEVILFEEKHNETAWSKVFKDFLHTVLYRMKNL